MKHHQQIHQILLFQNHLFSINQFFKLQVYKVWEQVAVNVNARNRDWSKKKRTFETFKAMFLWEFDKIDWITAVLLWLGAYSMNVLIAKTNINIVLFNNSSYFKITIFESRNQ